MSFTAITVTGTFTNADGTFATGQFCAKPSTLLVNGSDQQSVAPVCGVVYEDTGEILSQGLEAFIINATNDDGTTPEGAYYTFTLTLDGQSVVEFNAPIPNSPTTVTFESLYAGRI